MTVNWCCFRVCFAADFNAGAENKTHKTLRRPSICWCSHFMATNQGIIIIIIRETAITAAIKVMNTIHLFSLIQRDRNYILNGKLKAELRYEGERRICSFGGAQKVTHRSS